MASEPVQRSFKDLRVASSSHSTDAHGAGGGARTRDRRVTADLREDSQATVPPTPTDRSCALPKPVTLLLALKFEIPPRDE
ncbi:hypothetical protein PoB_000203600 [Plakobranchus ocellatus]|uniref:Uncharacterized protein n=1 Tax=Plakobranchus ocellatus TaxID=259542 RepID=A0AAV3X7D3_9GAST|nr:hypothetical protein PoB_000203600 [Plakobranchus ocellatus]